MLPQPQPAPTAVYTVSSLTGEMRGVVGDAFGDVWVRGEVSQWRPSASGHVYFTLKDEGAVLPCVLWRSSAVRLKFRVEDGQELLVRGGIDVYPPHGKYQLVVRHLEPLGKGALQIAFEQMRKRLEAEGLFAKERKVPLPTMPRRIALVTSPKGAAVRDLVTVIHRRFPSAVILLVAVPVQGPGAAAEVARGVAFADASARADVIIVGRGGGSLEDLWAFNEEVVARAIAACVTPIVSAVGHETDVTIADLVADVRAATPSQAGELVVPVRDDLLLRIDQEQGRLVHRVRVRLERAWQRLEALAERPVLRDHRSLLLLRRRHLEHVADRLRSRSPAAELRRRIEAVTALSLRLGAIATRRVARGRDLVDGLDHRLRALSPLAVLGRGYSLTMRADGRVVRGAKEVKAGDRLRTRLSDGAHLDSRVEAVEPPAPEP